MTDYEPMFSCQVERCAEQISYPAESLWVHNGEPICEGCCSEDNSIPSVCDLPPFVPAYQAEITRLNQEIDALHAEISHRKAGGHEVQKYTRMGKQILCNGDNFADGASEAASVIVLAALHSTF